MNKVLHKVEFLLLAILTAAVVLESTGTKLNILYLIGLGGLGLVFFLFAQFPLQNDEADKEESSAFKTILAFVIAPKILWIGTAVTTIGIMFYLLNLPGANNLLIIGGSTIAICTVILLVLRILTVRNLQTVIPILYRSCPALLVAAYFVFA